MVKDFALDWNIGEFFAVVAIGNGDGQLVKPWSWAVCVVSRVVRLPRYKTLVSCIWS